MSICSRSDKQPKELDHLEDWVSLAPTSLEMEISIAFDAKSIYEGHKQNIDYFKLYYNIRRSDIFVFLHDDVEILSSYDDFGKWMDYCLEPSVGFVGVAGAYKLGEDAIWWNSRRANESRGFVFQGKETTTMTPNYFGQSGEVTVLDGCFMACAGTTLELVGFKKPEYLTSDWDFYDIGVTMDAHMKGLRNHTVPLLIRHVSSGEMREDWYTSRKEFINHYKSYLPRSPALSMEATNGLPS